MKRIDFTHLTAYGTQTGRRTFGAATDPVRTRTGAVAAFAMRGDNDPRALAARRGAR